MEAQQLRIDGSEVPYSVAVAQHHAGLTEAQRLILKAIGEHEGIRPVEAGIIVHSFRTDRWHRAQDGYGQQNVENGFGCCKWASSDGVEALKRLKRRGFVRHFKRGWWVRSDFDARAAR